MIINLNITKLNAVQPRTVNVTVTPTDDNSGLELRIDLGVSSS